MKVMLDGQELSFAEDLEERVTARLKQENRVARSVVVNGVDMVNASLTEVLAEPVEGKVVEIVTCPAGELVRECMGDAREYIPKLTAGLGQMGERLLEGNVNGVYAMVDGALEGLEWLGLTFQAYISHGHGPAAAAEIFTREYARLGAVLKELEAALRANNLETACHIFEQQVIPFLEKILPLADEMLGHSPGDNTPN